MFVLLLNIPSVGCGVRPFLKFPSVGVVFVLLLNFSFVGVGVRPFIKYPIRGCDVRPY